MDIVIIMNSLDHDNGVVKVDNIVFNTVLCTVHQGELESMHILYIIDTHT